MSERINIQDIAEQLAGKHGMAKKDAETFVRGMFELIEEALIVEKYIKVKGLGTFKLIEVDKRESIHVNTGERIEIQGHIKISFTPDTSMKDLINKPFAHFETVILNESTQLEDTVTETQGEEEAMPIEEPASVAEEPTPIEEPAPVAEEPTPIETPAPIAEEPTPIEEPAPVAEEPTPIETPAPVAEEAAPIEETAPVAEEPTPIEEPAPVAEAPTPIEEPAPLTEEATPVMTIADAAILAASEGKTLSETIAPKEEKPSEEQEAEETAKITDTSEERKKQTPWGIILLAIVLIACIAGGIYWYLQPDKTPETQPADAIETAQAQGEETMPAAADADLSAQHQDTARTSTGSTGQETMNRPQATPAMPIKNPDVTKAGNTHVAKESLADTVEYDITGTKTSHTLQEGESLVKLALRFYGEKKLWPYIVKHNKDILKDANKVPVGTTLRIPQLTPKR